MPPRGAALAQRRRSRGVTQLSFWGGWTGPDGLAMQQFVRRFNAETRDVQVTLTLYNWDLIFDRWRTEFDGGSPPDIVGSTPPRWRSTPHAACCATSGTRRARLGLVGGDFSAAVAPVPRSAAASMPCRWISIRWASISMPHAAERPAWTRRTRRARPGSCWRGRRA